jgi:hypothetical protein
LRRATLDCRAGVFNAGSLSAGGAQRLDDLLSIVVDGQAI